MSLEIWHSYESGNNLYARIRRKTDGKVYDAATGGDTFDTWADADVGDYDVALTDYDGDFYAVNFPSGISGGTYDIGIFLRAGANPATDDVCLAQGEIYWTGDAETTLISVITAQGTIVNVFDDSDKGVSTPGSSITTTGRLVVATGDC